MGRTLFKKIVWAQIYLMLLYFAVIILFEFTPLFTDYSQIEDQLYEGLLGNLNGSVLLAVMVFLIALYIISWVLLLRFHKNGPIFYTVAVVSTVVVITVTGDNVSHGLLFPLDWLDAALDGLILYLIYLTPLKNEFGQSHSKTNGS